MVYKYNMKQKLGDKRYVLGLCNYVRSILMLVAVVCAGVFFVYLLLSWPETQRRSIHRVRRLKEQADIDYELCVDLTNTTSVLHHDINAKVQEAIEKRRVDLEEMKTKLKQDMQENWDRINKLKEQMKQRASIAQLREYEKQYEETEAKLVDFRDMFNVDTNEEMKGTELCWKSAGVVSLCNSTEVRLQLPQIKGTKHCDEQTIYYHKQVRSVVFEARIETFARILNLEPEVCGESCRYYADVFEDNIQTRPFVSVCCLTVFMLLAGYFLIDCKDKRVSVKLQEQRISEIPPSHFTIVPPPVFDPKQQHALNNSKQD